MYFDIVFDKLVVWIFPIEKVDFTVTSKLVRYFELRKPKQLYILSFRFFCYPSPYKKTVICEKC